MLNAFTVDVEDYFQVSAFEQRVSRRNWERYESRVVANTQQILRMLASHRVLGTFFILGWVADRYPQLIQDIARDGHEVASHGYWHRLVYDQSPEEFGEDVRQSLDAIGNACGVQALAYRAPSFSIVGRSLWALDVLASLGIKIDSSIFPISGHDRYGVPNAERKIHRIPGKNGEIIEFPPTAWHFGKLNLPIGGGYFRLLPWALTRQAFRMVHRSTRPAMFYIHPWEIDPLQPKIDGLSKKTRLRHYSGLRSTARKLEKLLKTFQFGSVSDVLNGTASISSVPIAP